MSLEFSNEYYFQRALELAEKRPASCHSVNQAFFQLIRGASFGKLENLIGLLQREYPLANGDAIYRYLQDPGESELVGMINGSNVVVCAYTCLKSGRALGNEIVPGRGSNASDWMGHCLLTAKCAALLAGALGLDPMEAMRLGMVHDIGRKITHSFAHTVKGFELLVDAGFEAEAMACLTHSFIGGGRCASNEPADPGFYVNDEGLPCWREDVPKDQLTQFLEVYGKYSLYDLCLNLADLMATGRAILSPSERLKDIATRKAIDPVNRGYFLAEFINLLNLWLEPAEPVRFVKGCTIEGMQERFEGVSARFWEKYQTMED